MEELTIGGLQRLVDDYVTERDWKRYHKPKDIAISISIESSELLELYQWKPEAADSSTSTTEYRVRTGEELADIIIYCACMANAMGMNFSDVLIDKIQKNREKYPIERVIRAKDWDDVRSARSKPSATDGDG